MRLLAIALLGGLTAGCATHMDTRPVLTSTTVAAVGKPYRIPALAYTLTTTRTLTKCKVNGSTLDIEFDVKTTSTAAYGPGEQFLADYRSLANLSTTSSFEIAEFPSGIIKSFNVSATNHGPEIVGSIVKLGFTVARISAGLPPPAPAGLAEPTPTCPASLGQADAAADGVKTLTDEITERTEKLQPFITEALVGTLTPQKKVEMTLLRAEIADRDTRLTKLRKQLEALQKGLTFDDEQRFAPVNGALQQAWVFPRDDSGLDDKAQKKWLAGLFGIVSPALKAQLKSQLSVVAVFAPEVPLSDPSTCVALGAANNCDTLVAPKPGTTSKPVVRGIIYREPAYGRLSVCQGFDAAVCQARNVPALVTSRDAAPQVGTLVVLPFSNGFGENNVLKVTFRESGGAELVSYERKTAPGVAMAKLLNDVANEKLAYDRALDTKNDTEAAAAKTAAAEALAAPNAALERDITRLTREQQIRVLLAASDPAALAQAKTKAQAQEAFDVQITDLTRQQQLRVLQSAGDPDVLARDRILADLNARIAQLQALQTIRTLEMAAAK